MPAPFRRALLIILPLTLLVLGLRLDGGRLRPEPVGQKPMFPILTGLQPIGSPEPGGVVRALATLTAWAPGETVEWALILPGGVTQLAGPSHWSGLLRRGETISFELAFQVPDGHQEVTARGWLPERPGATSAALLPIDLGGPVGLKATEQLVTGDGTSYIQYQGEVTPRGGAR